MDLGSLAGGIGGLVSVGGGIIGSQESVEGAKAKAAAQRQIAQLEIQADAQRRQAMEISARRTMLQTVRNAQQARSMALSAAVNQGAQFSSSAASGQAQSSNQAAYQNLGVSQNLQLGENLFNINAQIDQQKMAEADAETKIAEGQGTSSLFGSIGKAIPDIMKLATLIP
jgi:hypothetical protein